MVRRPVAWVAAIVLFVEAFGIALVNWFLGVVVDRQDMSLAGLDPAAMSVSSKVAGLVFGLYFALCGFVALRVALRDRAPAGLGRVLLISVAVVHGLLGAFTVGLVGWGAFAFMMVVLGLVVLILMAYDGREGAVSDAEPVDGAPNGGAPGDGSNGGAPVAPTAPPTPSAP
ncbi:hypothetical protein [Streptomyces sporangiiformans]|uniref:Uncharacterized protein n=1 Tax=Streptomyces sporangiiformans TaxID=2315329 RepID=A0A505DLM1_9ACTN|nr:hypothetical protein [Streptomyces sporangiiformans]TPQ20539.1 hypothetical protein FGD71_019855 [Streptomyces sporangiiformans]